MSVQQSLLYIQKSFAGSSTYTYHLHLVFIAYLVNNEVVRKKFITQKVCVSFFSTAFVYETLSYSHKYLMTSFRE